MAGFERPKEGYRFAFGGLKTNDSADAMAPNKHPVAENVRSSGGHSVHTRPGYELLFTTNVLSILSCPTGSPEVGVFYSYQMVVTGGIPPYLWSVASGALPDGLTINPNTGLISGTPTTAETANYTIEAEDSSGGVTSITQIACSLTVAAGVCTPWDTLTDYPPGVPEYDEIVDAGDFIYALSYDSGDGTQPILKIDKADGTILGSVKISTTAYTMQCLAFDATYIYVGGIKTAATSFIRVWRLLRSDFSTVTTLDLSDSGRVDQIEVNGSYLYVVPFQLGIKGLLCRVLLSDFTTNERVEWSDGNPTWTKDQQRICIDASFIYVLCRIGGAAPADTLEVSRISNPGFVFVDDFQYNTGLATGLVPNVNGPPVQDSGFIYLVFSRGAVSAGMIKVDKPTMGNAAVQTYSLPGTGIAWSLLSGTDIYMLSLATAPGLILKILTTDLSETDRMSLSAAGGVTLVKDGDEFFMSNYADDVGNPPSRVSLICEFVPD